MKLSSRNEQGRTVLMVEGRLDTLTTPEFDTCWQSLVEGGERKLILDLAALTYVSSAGLGETGIEHLAYSGEETGHPTPLRSLAFAEVYAVKRHAGSDETVPSRDVVVVEPSEAMIVSLSEHAQPDSLTVRFSFPSVSSSIV